MTSCLRHELAGAFTVVNDELVDALFSILRNGGASESLRSRAAISLGPVLEHADAEGFDDPENVRISQQKFREIQLSLRELYDDRSTPSEVRRRVLEASVRAPEAWHEEAIRTAFTAGDEAWILTATFCMQFVRGFEQQILKALSSENPDIQREAVLAAGNWGFDTAWPRIVALVESANTDKSLVFAAIDAIASIRPEEASEVLGPLTDSDDEDIVEAVHEALAMADAESSGDEDDEDFDDDDSGDDRYLN